MLEAIIPVYSVLTKRKERIGRGRTKTGWRDAFEGWIWRGFSVAGTRLMSFGREGTVHSFSRYAHGTNKPSQASALVGEFNFYFRNTVLLLKKSMTWECLECNYQI